MTPLVAILGAGASRGSGEYRPSTATQYGAITVPPLTRDLFDEHLFSEVLSQYGLAHQAGRFITRELAVDDTLGLEQALHGLQSGDPHHQHMAKAVPPYLQALLHEVSEARYTEALHYDRLIERLLRLPRVFFVSLNYDVLLDRRLDDHYPLANLRAYIETGRNWSLIKPHGSINWYHQAAGLYVPAAPPLDLEWDMQTFECVSPTYSLGLMRSPAGDGSSRFPTDRYPALAVPEGPDDRLVLPGEHSRWFEHELRIARLIDILVIGYSGLDRAVREFIAQTGCEVRHLTVVNQNVGTAAEVLERFRESGLDPTWHKLIDGGFASWSNDGGLNQLVDEYDGPYPDSG
jgi:hypothetical protein